LCCVCISIKQRVCFRFHTFQERVLRWIKPPTTSLVLSMLADMTRSKAQLLAENALLRQQLIILRRQVKRPVCRKKDRLLLLLMARMVRTWTQALFLVQPETLLRWHRELFRMFWKRISKAHMRTFLRTHAAEVWACDFLQVPDLFFRTLFAFFIIELKSRKVIYVNVTRTPTDSWVAQQLREATPYGERPTYPIRDNDRKFGPNFTRMAATSGIEVLRTPYRTPRANAVCERFLGSVRRECLNHFFILHEKQLQRLLNAYVRYFNQARPHQGLGQRIPDPPVRSTLQPNQPHKVIAVPVLGGLHHDYQSRA
jgi:transposase InsO family protein